MLVAIDAVGIREGGGASILTELLHWLPQVRPNWHWHVFLLDRQLRTFDDPAVTSNVVLESTRRGNSGIGRVVWVNWHLPRRLQQIGADVVFSFANVGSSSPPIPQIVYWQQRLILFPEARADYPFFERQRLRVQGFFALRGARASAAVIVQTDGMRERLLQVEPGLHGKIHVIPSGYRTPPAKLSLRAEKQQLIDRCARPRLLYVSVLRQHKNHLNLMRAFAEIVRMNPGAQLLLTVDEQIAPYPEVTDLLSELSSLVRELGLSERVVWLGQLTPDEVTYALSQSDLFVFPSLAESFGLPLVEAMAAGLPIAAADLGYAREVAGPAAAYFDPHSPQSIASCVVKLLPDANELNRLRSAGEVRRSLFHYERIAEQIAQVFEAVA